MLHPNLDGTPSDGSRVDRLLDATIMTGLVVLILVGFITSYRTLRDLAATAGGYPTWLAPAVPLSFDLGIVVLSLKVVRAAREGRTAPVMKLLVVGLSTATVLANVSIATTSTAKLLHAVSPAMFVICFESVVITARRQALLSQGLLAQPLPRLRLATWALAPRSSWATWRSMVLDVGAPRQSEAHEQPNALQQGRSRSAALRSPSPPSSSDQKRKLVTQALIREPAMTSQGLKTYLEQQGHSVSLRTAQRLRAASDPGAAT